MSSPYPPSAPKKLYRSRSKRMIAGVCGGLADYLNMDPTLVRILTVVISLFTGIPIVLYIVALFVVPEEPAPFPPQGYPPVNGPQSYDNPYAAPAPGAPYGNTAYGQPPVQQDAQVWGPAGAPWEQASAANTTPGAGAVARTRTDPTPGGARRSGRARGTRRARTAGGAGTIARAADGDRPGRAGARGRCRGVVRGTRSPGGLRRGPAQELTL